MAYSRLSLLLVESGLTTAELRRRLLAEGTPLGRSALRRFQDMDRSLDRVDLRAIGAICRILGVGIGDLIYFSEEAHDPVVKLPATEQERLDVLLDRHDQGDLSGDELKELRELVAKADDLSRANVHRLAKHRRRMQGEHRTDRAVS